MKDFYPMQMVRSSYIFSWKGELRFSYLGIACQSITLKFSFELSIVISKNFITRRLSLMW